MRDTERDIVIRLVCHLVDRRPNRETGALALDACREFAWQVATCGT